MTTDRRAALVALVDDARARLARHEAAGESEAEAAAAGGERYEVAPTGSFRCLDCRRSGREPGASVKHARNCSWYPNQIHTPVEGVAAEQANAERIEAAHAAGICTWTKADGQWVVTGPESVLRSGTVTVQAKGKAPEQVRVSAPWQVGGRWVAARIGGVRPSAGGASGERTTMSLVGTTEGADIRLEYRLDGRTMPSGWVAERVGKAVETRSRKDGDRIVFVLGAEGSYTSAAWEEDCGVPGTPSGWTVTLHCRLATDEEAAPLREAAAAKARAEAEAKAAETAKRDAYLAAKAEATAGMVCFALATVQVRYGETIATLSDRSSHLRLMRGAIKGRDGIAEAASFGDDDRLFWYLPREAALAVLDDEIHYRSLHPDLARERIATGRFHGDEIFRRAAGLDPFAD